jgi:hypothetical protein
VRITAAQKSRFVSEAIKRAKRARELKSAKWRYAPSAKPNREYQVDTLILRETAGSMLLGLR